MPTLDVLPRPTPLERADAAVTIEVDEDLTVLADQLEEWVTPRQAWDVRLRQGTDFDKPNNVEAILMFASGEQTSTLLFRLDQLDSALDTGEELMLRFEEQDGISKVARLHDNGLDVELFHILTIT